MSFQSAIAQVVHHQSSQIPAGQLTFLASSDAFAAAAAADRDVDACMVAMIESLSGTSLDPLRGTEVGHFVREWDGVWCFHLSFHRLSHFVNVFSATKGSPLAAELITAIEANLQSTMFKAARADRRLSQRFTSLRGRSRRRYLDTYQAHVATNSRDGMSHRERTEVIALAEDAAALATAPRDASLRLRERFISQRAMPAVADRSYSQWVADRLEAVLPHFVPAEV